MAVLVIDHDDQMREIMRKMINKIDPKLEVECISSPYEIRSTKLPTYDFAIVDFPSCDDLSFLKNLKESSFLIGMCGNLLDPENFSLFDTYLEKPFCFGDLKSSIEKIPNFSCK